MKEVVDETATLFNCASSYTLAKTQSVVNLLFALLKTDLNNDSCEEWLSSKSVWDVCIPKTIVEKRTNECPNISFIRAHYSIYRKVLSKTQSVTEEEIDHVTLVKRLYDHLRQERTKIKSNKIFEAFEEKVERIYKIIVDQEQLEEIPFTQDDLGLPFLFERLNQLNNLKFFILEEEKEIYKLDNTIVNGRRQYGPFRLAGHFYEIDYFLFFSTDFTITGSSLGDPLKLFLVDEYTIAYTSQTDAITKVHKNIQHLITGPGDLDYLSKIFLKSMESKEMIVLDERNDNINESGYTDVSALSTITKIQGILFFQKHYHI